MLFLLDTNAVSDLMSQHPGVDARLAATPPTDRVVSCVIVRGEILFGIELLSPGRKRQDLDAKAQTLFAKIPFEPVPVEAAEYYALAKSGLRRKGVVVDENDIWIAATAQALNATLITRDQGFQQIDGLTVEDWTN